MVLFPVLLMLFALGMERVENRLRKLLEPDEEVQQYLDKANASNAEVKELSKLGLPAAVARMRKKRARDPELDVARAS
ncbi:hypothetical protein [Nocardia camponoti]|uniref:Uncharacterized protein n=1 Tax=Nocardia camponoti TaxID=1616106 RepID=A0A917QNP3_9NOCA|nr:hypothetical protein [Nocardia camponoti]GGK60741.1 hypothetical protein GCM10011591_36310 [Nocardia camponoti]